METYEIVFEGVPASSAPDLLQQLLERARNVVDVQCADQDLSFKRPIDFELVRNLCGSGGDFALMVNVQGLEFNGVVLPSALVRLIQYSGHFDIDISFGIAEPQLARDMMCRIHALAITFAKQFAATSFFGGLEPAADAGTQYFHEEQAGPMARM